jgi:hypothetical protein
MTAAYQPSREQEPKPSEMRQFATAVSLDSPETLRKENDQLRMALVTRIVIEQAKGMLAERLAVEVDEAFARLRREARNRRMKLHALAVAVIAREAWAESAFQAGEPRNPTERTSRAGTRRLSSPTTTLAEHNSLQRPSTDRHTPT